MTAVSQMLIIIIVVLVRILVFQLLDPVRLTVNNINEDS